jgi:NADH pyrophosphatase NudC (nudix superfamily)
MRLIDADAFWNRLQQVVYDIFTYPADGEQYAHVGYYTETIQEVLKQTKTIEARPVVRGEWRRCYDDSAGWGDMCDQCGEFGDGTNFCPNCGADMRTKEEE